MELPDLPCVQYVFHLMLLKSWLSFSSSYGSPSHKWESQSANYQLQAYPLKLLMINKTDLKIN